MYSAKHDEGAVRAYNPQFREEVEGSVEQHPPTLKYFEVFDHCAKCSITPNMYFWGVQTDGRSSRLTSLHVHVARSARSI